MIARVIVTAATAPMAREPRVSEPQISQCVYGHALELLEERGEWRRVRGADDYEGWVHRGYVMPYDGAAVEARRTSLGCVVRDVRGRRRPLPLGALLDPADQLMEGDAVAPDEMRRRFPRDAGAVAVTARDRFEGTPYEWGGVTPWGADCSGLVQTSFALHGVVLPRDAWQQAARGTAVGAPPGALASGDLLFFSDRPDHRITHVAIALGEGRIVHLALGRGGWAVERLDDTRDPYVVALRERYLFARRIALD